MLRLRFAIQIHPPDIYAEAAVIKRLSEVGKPIWKMKRDPILEALSSASIQTALAHEYQTNPDILSASAQMRAQLASGCKVDAEQATTKGLVALESLSVVAWRD